MQAIKTYVSENPYCPCLCLRYDTYVRTYHTAVPPSLPRIVRFRFRSLPLLSLRSFVFLHLMRLRRYVDE